MPIELPDNIHLSDDIDAVDWNRLAEVFERAPLGKRDPEVLRQTFLSSGVRCFALNRAPPASAVSGSPAADSATFDGSRIIAAGRAITDHIRFALILDVVVLPEYQGQGIGRRIMQFLARRSGAANMLLHSVPGKEGFYQRLGYRRMKTAMALFANPAEAQQHGHIE